MRIAGHDSYTAVYKKEEFLELRESALSSWDGGGYWATETWHDMDSPIWNDEWNVTEAPEWATHVAWYNK